MWIESLKMKNIRSFESERITFSKGINILLGANNCGKSTIIGSIARFQNAGSIRKDSTRVGTTGAYAEIKLLDAQKYFELDEEIMISDLDGNPVRSENAEKELPNKDPDYFIYPFLSHRKVERYDDSVKKEESNRIRDDNGNLSYRLLEISGDTHPSNQEYLRTSRDVLGFAVSNIPARNGSSPGIYAAGEPIYLESMGDGVGMITSFLSRLAGTKGKAFLIEEPENDLHPTALKKLLEYIIEASQYNQFIISTHSNIVVRALGGVKDTRIISLYKPEEPIESLTQVKYLDNPEERNQALLDLGYDVNDLDSYGAWLFFEEASMEKIVRDVLIPKFIPNLLGKVKTFSTRGFGNMPKRFNELNSLFVYLHLDSKYKNRAWVFVDQGADEEEMLANLKKVYVEKHKWNKNCFIQLKNHDLEEYYPAKFNKDKKKVKDAKGSKDEKSLKAELCEKVIAWSIKDKKAGSTLEKSFKEVIEHLKLVEKQLKAKK